MLLRIANWIHSVNTASGKHSTEWYSQGSDQLFRGQPKLTYGVTQIQTRIIVFLAPHRNVFSTNGLHNGWRGAVTCHLGRHLGTSARQIQSHHRIGGRSFSKRVGGSSEGPMLWPAYVPFHVSMASSVVRPSLGARKATVCLMSRLAKRAPRQQTRNCTSPPCKNRKLHRTHLLSPPAAFLCRNERPTFPARLAAP